MIKIKVSVFSIMVIFQMFGAQFIRKKCIHDVLKFKMFIHCSYIYIHIINKII